VIDRHIKAPWPPEVAEALAHFRQGDLIERPPFFYGRHATIEIFDAGGPAEEESQVHEVHPDDAPPYGIITTQTCDINEQGTPTQPWIQVSPVYPLDDDEPPRKAYLVELTGPAGKHLVADLRIELPLEKSLLAGRVPIRGFATEEQENAFGRLLGTRRARAALANELVDTVIHLIGKRKSNNKGKSRPVWAQLWRLGLQIEEGTRLKPVAVRLHVLSIGQPSDQVLGWFADWEDATRVEAEAVGITLLTTRHHDATNMDAQLADRLVPLAI
jgi:hypothetical protein